MLYAEDLTPGREFPFSTWTMTEKDIVEYARQWDPLPMHIDAGTAAAGPHGGIIASGLHTLAVYQRLAAEVFWSKTHGVGGRGLQARFLRPVKPGTTLSGYLRIDRVDQRPERRNAVVYVVSRLTDEAGEIMLEVAVDAAILRRPKA